MWFGSMMRKGPRSTKRTVFSKQVFKRLTPCFLGGVRERGFIGKREHLVLLDLPGCRGKELKAKDSFPDAKFSHPTTEVVFITRENHNSALIM